MVRKQQLTVSILLDSGSTVTVATLEDLGDHCSPAAPGALIKCVLLAHLNQRKMTRLAIKEQ